MKGTPTLKLKKCGFCKDPFMPARPLQKCCSPKCAMDLVEKSKAKAERRDYFRQKEKLKTRSDWLKDAQKAFNAYVRLRDAKEPCISCGRHHNGQWHAGHFRSTGAAPHLRFDEGNVHKQCAPCNTHLHGNLIEYRLGLIARRGLEEVERLESTSDGPKQTIEYLKEVISTYRRKARELEKS